MPRRNLAWLLGISSVALLGLAVSHSAPPREKDRDYELVRLVVDVLDEVEHKYVRPLDAQAKRKFVEDMVNGGLDHLDPHSGFINEKQYKRFTLTNKGKFGGVGIQIEANPRKGGQLTVISPMVDTPAYEAGVLPGDLILKIDGKPTDTMGILEAVDLITGDPGTKVVLSVLHEGSKKPMDLEMTRALIEVQSVLGDVRKPENPKEWEFYIDKQQQIGYVRLIAFSETTATELHTILAKLQKEGLHGLVLDLRTNPGGLLRSAVEVCRMFMNEGRIVSTKGRNQQEEVYDARPGGALLPSTLPVVVLIDRLSASASEIVAAALQDNNRAIIIGERSYGKGSVQNIIEMEGHKSALKLTTASYWRPSGKNIHRFPDSKESDEWGVQPSAGFEVALTDEERRQYLDYRRNRDALAGKGGARPAKVKAEKAKDEEKEPFQDRTLQKALEYIRGHLEKVGAASSIPESANS
jgi:carboxyl-terminal processing protease